MYLYINDITQDVCFGPNGGRKLSNEDMNQIRKFKKGSLTKCISDLTVKDCLLIITMDIYILDPHRGGGWRSRIYFKNTFLRYVPSRLYLKVSGSLHQIKKQNDLAYMAAEKKWNAERKKKDYHACFCPFTGKRYESPYHVPQYTPDEKAFISYMSQVKVDIMPPREATPFVTQHKYDTWLSNYSIQNVFSSDNKDRKVPSQTKSKLELDSEARRSQMW